MKIKKKFINIILWQSHQMFSTVFMRLDWWLHMPFLSFWWSLELKLWSRLLFHWIGPHHYSACHCVHVYHLDGFGWESTHCPISISISITVFLSDCLKRKNLLNCFLWFWREAWIWWLMSPVDWGKVKEAIYGHCAQTTSQEKTSLWGTRLGQIFSERSHLKEV